MARMTLQFLGGAQTVTGSKYLLSVDGRRVLVDAGLFQGEKKWRELNWAELPFPARDLDLVLITHAHLDHIGYLPALVAQGFGGTIYATADTVALSDIVLMDAGHLQEREAQHAAEEGYSKHESPEPLYTVADVERTLPLFKAVPFDTDLDLGDGLVARWTRAGHILGSASIHVRHGDDAVLFSGDLGRHDHPLLRPRDTPPGAAITLIESTYGDREHPEPDGPPHEVMAEVIRRTIGRGGSVLIPAFAVDRTPVVLKSLAQLQREGRIPDVPIFVNSPMALAGLAVYRRAGASGELREDLHLDDFLNLDNLREVGDAEESKKLNNPAQPCIIIASSGMATGGRVLHHLEHMLPNPKHAVIFTGYQGVGTRGRQLLDGAREMKFRGRFIPVKAEIVADREFSVHGDASDLIDWLRDLVPQPTTVFCVHGEEQAAGLFAERIHRELGLTAVVAQYREVVTIGATEGLPAAQPVAAPRVPVTRVPLVAGDSEVMDEAVPRATPSAPLPTRSAPAAATRVRGTDDTHADDADQVRIILDTALGQVAFLPEEKRDEVRAALHATLALVDVPLDRAGVQAAANKALYAAAAAVETPGGQSIVALLAHIPRVLG